MRRAISYVIPSLWKYAVLSLTVALVCVDAVAQSRGARSNADSEWIVFSSGRSGRGDIYAVSPTSGEVILWAGTSEPESSVRYDAFRDRVVHTRYGGRGAMLVSGERELFGDPNGDVSPQWSPDGWRIVYSAIRDGREDLFIARTDGSREKRLTNDVEEDRYPAWSPDGVRIVFARRDSAGWDLFTLDLRNPSSVPERLTERGVYVGHPDWSPDGRRIVFDTRVEGQTEIAMVDVETGEFVRLTQRDGNDLVPAWSLDGERVAFGGRRDSTGNWDIWTVEVKTGVLDRVTEHADFDGGPVFVPGSALGRD